MKNTSKKISKKITSKEVRGNNVEFSTSKITPTWVFRPSKLHRKEYVGTTQIFCPSKLHRKKYVGITWVFRPAKLRRKNYLEATSIFRTKKLHWKSTWTWCGNSLKFGLCRIDVISTSNRGGFKLVCPLGLFSTNLVLRRTIVRFRECSSIWSILFCISSIFWWSIGHCR